MKHIEAQRNLPDRCLDRNAKPWRSDEPRMSGPAIPIQVELRCLRVTTHQDELVGRSRLFGKLPRDVSNVGAYSLVTALEGVCIESDSHDTAPGVRRRRAAFAKESAYRARARAWERRACAPMREGSQRIPYTTARQPYP